MQQSTIEERPTPSYKLELSVVVVVLPLQRNQQSALLSWLPFHNCIRYLLLTRPSADSVEVSCAAKAAPQMPL